MAQEPALAIVGGGIAGLATALALGQRQINTVVFERADAFTEAGAGIGLGPNATRLLQAWGLGKALQAVACTPDSLLARDAIDGKVYGRLPMGQSFIDHYGAPYLTVHRADLHAILLDAVIKQSTTELLLNHTLTDLLESEHNISLAFNNGANLYDSQAVIGADGLHSRVRHWVAGDAPPVATGHWAYRTLLRASDLPVALRSSHLGIWMGRHLHVVHYPVRSGDYINLVVLLESQAMQAQPGWDLQLSSAQIAHDLQSALRGCCTHLQDLIHAASQWRAWCLFDRPVVQQPSQLAQRKLALLGDAAHPMLPYLAQGAGMALEDAACLALHWPRNDLPPEQRLSHYAQARWQRVAKVQQRARRNSEIFHADGALRVARNAALKLAGARLMDMPWLYAA